MSSQKNKLTQVRYILLLVSSLWAFCSHAQSDLGLAALLIPDSLKKNADAVILDSRHELVINSGSLAGYYVENVVTVLNEDGDKYGKTIIFYDPSVRVVLLEISIYDVFGSMVKKVKPSEIQDISDFTSYSLYTDNRIKVYVPEMKKYPYTVKTKCKIEYDGFINLPDWQPQSGSRLAVKHAVFSLKTPADLVIRTRSANYPGEPFCLKEKKDVQYLWEVKNLKAVKDEPFLPPLKKITPSLTIAPNNFNYEGHKGSMNSWNELGSWIYSLMINRDELDMSTISELNEYLNGSSDTIDIVKKIYEYMQGKTRYVSVQYGIGGFRPIAAATVDKVGYGDCKALSNYTKALLKTQGIRSVYTVVEAGEENLNEITDFVRNQFNHVILFVPMKNDTIWLECTSQDQPFNYLGRFTCNRKALAVDEKGGVMVQTAVYDPENNYTSTKCVLKVDSTGNCKLVAKFRYKGLDYDDAVAFIRLDELKRKDQLCKSLNLSNFVINKVNVDQKKSGLPEAEIFTDIVVKNYASVSGNRIFIPVNRINSVEVPEKCEKRENDIYLDETINQYDTLMFEIPHSYTIERLPEDIELINEFGIFRLHASFSDNVVLFYRYLNLKKGFFPASRYPDFYNFFKSVSKSDNSSLVIRKKAE